MSRSAWIRFVITITILTLPRIGQSQESIGMGAILQREASGQSVDRRKSNDVFSDNFSAWQAGFVMLNDRWMSAQDAIELKGDQLYLEKRTELDNHPNKHAVLAKWCVAHKLPDQARAHYYQTLVHDPNHLEARNFLGHVRFGETWVEEKAFADSKDVIQQKLGLLDDWVPKIKNIVLDLKSGHPKQMSNALKQLDGIDADEAMGSLEFFAANIDDDLSKPLIRKIASVRSREACLSLVRIALNHPSAEIHSLASESIQRYPLEHYVPELLNMLVSETDIENRIVMHANGNVGLDTLFRNELRDKKQVSRATRLVNVVAVFSSSHRIQLFNTTEADISYWSEYWKVPKNAPAHWGNARSKASIGSGASSERSKYVPQYVVKTAAGNLQEQGEQRARAVSKQNREVQQYSNRVCSLLRATSGEKFDDNPENWWSWWNDYNERYQADKPTAYSASFQKERIVVATQVSRQTSIGTHSDLGPMLIQYSCLVAGTPIQTTRGLVPVDKIQIGDLVVSQNIETAELAIKPVILTTVRPPKETFRIDLGGDSIEATGGHLWWVSGSGWVKTRDLRPGNILHTIAGTSEISRVEFNSQPKPSYNLVVDEFHTYFVGGERVLSYDNSIVQPTLRQIPGYGQTQSAAVVHR
jgi:hypothetical protein